LQEESREREKLIIEEEVFATLAYQERKALVARLSDLRRDLASERAKEMRLQT
jgi:hypothetical protein